jgi:hypothetical protein
VNRDRDHHRQARQANLFPSHVLVLSLAALLTGAAFVFKYHLLGEQPGDDELFRRLLAGAVIVIAALIFRLVAAFWRAR